MKFAFLSACLASALVVGPWASDLQAELWPSFSLDYSAKHATHIVVVSKEGVVQENWRGDLAKGERLPYPAADKPIPVVAIRNFSMDESQSVKEVTGNRRVLFLKRSQDQKDWVPANVNQPDLKLATVWVEGSFCFAIYQFMNPGDKARMYPLFMMTEATLKEQIEKIAKPEQEKSAPAPKKADDLTGKWRVLLPAGFEREITITAGEAGEYHLAPKSLTFGGTYELNDGMLVSDFNLDQRGQFFWNVNSPYLLTLTEQTASVGSDYTGAVLFRNREEAK